MLNSSRMSGQGTVSGTADAKDLYINQLMREIKELKMNDTDYKNIASTVSNMEKRYSQMKAEKSQNEITNAKKHDELVDRLANLRTRIDDYKNRIQEKESECKNISEDIEGAQRLHTSKKQAVDQLNFELDDLINKKSQLENELANLKNIHGRVISEREEYFTNVQLGNRRLDEIIRNEKALEEENADLEARIEARRRGIEAMNGQVGEIERDIEGIRAEIDEKESECNESEKIIISLTTKVDNEKRHRDTEKSELDSANLEFTRLLNTINELQLNLQKTQAKLRNKEKKLEEKKQEISCLESKTESVKSRNEEVEDQIDILRNNIEKTISLCKDHIRELEEIGSNDERVRQRLNRKRRVDELIAKCNTRISQF